MRKWNILVWILIILNLIDGFGTYYFVTRGYAREANPLMAAMINWSPISFLLLKIVATPFLLLMRNPAKAWIKALIGMLFCAYVYVCSIHAFITLILLRGLGSGLQ